MTPEQLSDLKSRSTCRKCQRKGPWAQDHGPDGNYPPLVKRAHSDSAAGRQNAKTVTFNMVRLGTHYNEAVSYSGPLLDDGAPYSGLGEKELEALAPVLLPFWDKVYEPIPASVASCPLWQYGSGTHSSKARKIVGSVVLCATSDQGSPVEIRHLVIEGSSQWIIGRNVTRHCDIEHIRSNSLLLPGSDSHTISIEDRGFHSYLPYDIFVHSSQKNPLIQISS